MLKLLHAADLHLDSSFSDSLQKGAARRAKLRSAFSNLIRFAAEREVDLVLLSGDLFDREFVTESTAALLVREMASLPQCRFFISPGNHDPYTASSLYARTEFPDNVTVFTQPTVSCISLDDLNTDVYGYAFCDGTLAHAPIDKLRPSNPERINLLCAHADLGAVISPYAPMTREQLASSEMDYAALGHIHLASGLQKTGNTYYAYPGCLEGRGFDETGYKGALYVEIEKENGALTVRAAEKRFSFGRYESATVDLTGALTAEDAVASLRSSLSEKKLLGLDTTLRLILTGSISPSISNLPEQVRTSLSNLVYALEIRDQTQPLLDFALLAQDPTVRGAFYRQLLPQLESDDEETRLRASRALTLGLSALADEPAVREFPPIRS